MKLDPNAMAVRFSTGALLLLALAGCASMDEGSYKFSDGWRHATVAEILRGADVTRPRFWTCLRDVPELERSGRTYVVATYRGPHHRQSHLVSAPIGEVLRPGDKVHLNVSACENAIVKRDEARQ